MTKKLRIKDFVNGPLRGASDYFNRRTMPHIMDGFMTGQRKVISAALDMSAASQIKVSSLAARTIESKHYIHGDAALMDSIVHLAQDFPGANNINLLEPLGTFGTAKKKDNASPRYIETKLSKAFWQCFSKDDQKIVTPQFYEGDEIEPEFYIPLLPMVLVNGSDGIGSGYRSFILPYNPKDLKRAICEVIDSGAVKKPLAPWMRGWKGKVAKDASTGQVSFYGVIDVASKTKIVISELPPKYDLIKYKAFLNGLVDKGVIKDYTNQSQIGEWQIEINCTREFTEKNTKEKLIEILGLVQKESENIVCWGVDRRIRVFKSVEALLVEWYNERIKFAAVSLSNKLAEESEELQWLKCKLDFLDWWNENAKTLVDLDRENIQKKAVEDIDILNEHPKYLTRLFEIRLLNLAKDETEMLQKQITEKTRQVQHLGSFTPASWYRSNLEGAGLG